MLLARGSHDESPPEGTQPDFSYSEGRVNKTRIGKRSRELHDDRQSSAHRNYRCVSKILDGVGTEDANASITMTKLCRVYLNI